MSAPVSPPDSDWRAWADSQRLILRGIRAETVRCVFLRVQQGQAEQARQSLRHLAPRVAGADADAVSGPGAAWQVAFTFDGLEALALQGRRLDPALLDDMARRAPAFAQGAERRAPDRLGDVADSAPERWEGWCRQRPHLVVSLHGSPAQVAVDMQTLKTWAGADAGGWEIVGTQDAGGVLDRNGPGQNIPLGLRDGITQLRIRGVPLNPEKPPPPEGLEHPVGDFLLGHPDGDGANVWAVPAHDAALGRGIYRDGSFGVLRKMQLHAEPWQRYLRAVCEAYGKDSPDEVVAKLLGRWPDGRPALGAGALPGAATKFWDDFDFSKDPAGLACPWGSHIRRMQPRGDTTLVGLRSRPLIRRGLPYRQAAQEGGASSDPSEGLLGMFFCADLTEQFEHLLAQWARADALGSRNTGCAQDPFAPGKPDGRAFQFPGWSLLEGKTAPALPVLTTTRGTLYLFYPSLSALAGLADAH